MKTVRNLDDLARAMFGLEDEMRNHLASDLVQTMAVRAKQLAEEKTPSRSSASLKVKRKYKPMKKSFSLRKGDQETPLRLVNRAAGIHVIDKGRYVGTRTIKPRRPKPAKGKRREKRTDQAQWKTIKLPMGSESAPEGITKPVRAQLEAESEAIMQAAIDRMEAKF